MNLDQIIDTLLEWVAELRTIDAGVRELKAMAQRGDLVTRELDRARQIRSERLERYRSEAARLMESCEMGE